ncbi:MAG: sulfatase-like hydrolase/transferase [Deltaproteobacteria bacterium]|nr:MAG: sulfatase-like hydrolase/transferase [Deltaproteobacteria bacterium]
MAGLALLGCVDAAQRSDAPPNLVLIVADDHGYTDFGFMGSPHVATPHLDRLAQEGTLFTRGFNTASVCGPSLRTLLTGQHPYQWDHHVARMHRRGVRRARGEEIQDFGTLPRWLQGRGYASFQGGKFWEASYAVAGFTHGMQRFGDDIAWGGSSTHLGRTTMEPLYAFIDAHRAQPFLVWFTPKLPHVPHDAAAEYRKPYQGLGFSDDAVRYYANITRLDAVVGELLAHLEGLGLRERTLVVFLTDNGWDQGPHAERRQTMDGPRGKRSMYELGFRTPIVFHGPGRVPAGAVHDELVSTVDLVPTLLDYAGAAIPDALPGRSLRPWIEGTGPWTRNTVIGGRMQTAEGGSNPDLSATDWRRSTFFVRSDRWHYIWDVETGDDVLFDMERDPQQQHDVVSEHPVLAPLFRDVIRRWQTEMARGVEIEPD